MTVESDLRSLRPGDVIKIERTLEYGYYDGFNDLFYFHDAQSKQLLALSDIGVGSLKVEMVKRKARKVKAGDVLPADEFRSRTWKPGTLVEHATIKDHKFVLLGEGEWVNLTDSSYAYKITDFTSEDGYKLVYVA